LRRKELNKFKKRNWAWGPEHPVIESAAPTGKGLGGDGALDRPGEGKREDGSKKSISNRQ